MNSLKFLKKYYSYSSTWYQIEMTSVVKIYQSNILSEILDFFKSNDVILESKLCTKCSQTGRHFQMKFATRPINGTPAWRCTKCNSFASIREGSFLSNFRFPLEKVLKLIHSWSLELPVVDVSNSLDVSRPTVISFF